MEKRIQYGIESVGWIPHNQMSEFYHRADICVIPSLWEEPFGIAALEAMAAGVPVIAIAVGGLKQIIKHKKTGFLISPGNPNKFYNSIIQLLTDKGLRREIGKRGNQEQKNIPRGNIMKQYETVFS